ncbi:MAG TPA: lysophospholipid acyltransferase family protein [Chthoniobacterales bacterium]|nr:lysophospholipid acyltransferase family protein [Chthoniobacterales bacterium]
MRAGWKQFRYRLEWLAVKAAGRIVPLLPRTACYHLAQFIGGLAPTLDRRNHRVALSNLEAAFGDRFSPAERQEIARESYRQFARTMVDLFWTPALTPENISRYVDFENPERLFADIAPSNRCIFAVFHYGNFEWLAHRVAWAGLPTDVVAQEFKNPLLDGIFQRLREYAGHTSVLRNKAIVRSYKTLLKGGRVALFVDTSLAAHHPTVVIDCFGLKTLVTVAHAWLYEKTGAALIPVYCEPLPGGRMRVVAQPKIEVAAGASHQEIAQACWDAFEPVVRQNPTPWLWMYKHWRYKPIAADRPYPFYSQESPFFEQIASRPNYAKLDRSAALQMTLS